MRKFHIGAVSMYSTYIVRVVCVMFSFSGFLGQTAAQQQVKLVRPDDTGALKVQKRNNESAIDKQERTDDLPVTFTEPNAASINVDGKEYDLKDAIDRLMRALESGNPRERRKWIYRVSAFRTDLPKDVITRLISAFDKESVADVRRAIIGTVQASKNTRFIDLCVSAKNDPDPLIRLRAGVSLIEMGNYGGLEILTQCLDELDGRAKYATMVQLMKANNELDLGFTNDEGVVETELFAPESIEVLSPRWKSWWKKNRAHLILRDRANASTKPEEK